MRHVTQGPLWARGLAAQMWVDGELQPSPKPRRLGRAMLACVFLGLLAYLAIEAWQLASVQGWEAMLRG